jgi:hypothetical protein
MAASRAKPFLLLNLDINKTILLSDPAANATTHDLINMICAEAAWGYVTSSPTGPPSWRLATAVCSVLPPSPGLVSFNTFLQDFAFPYDESAPADESELAAKVAFNRASKKKRQELVARFTDRGSPGESLRPLFDLLLSHLELPAAARERCCDHPDALPAWREGRHYLLPAYFRLVESLLASGRHFAVVFRTFGDDLSEVVREHNMWCNGSHPLHALPVSIPPSVAAQLVIRMPLDTGRFIRHGTSSSETLLAVVSGSDAAARVNTISGFIAIHEHILEAVGAKSWLDSARYPELAAAPAAPRAFAIQDHYAYWFSLHESGSAGKVLGVNPDDPLLHPLFLDDNVGSPLDGQRLLPPSKIIELAAAGIEVRNTEQGVPAPGGDEDTGIIDVRDLRSGCSLPLSEVNGVFVSRADPLSAILSGEYLVELVRLCEEKRSVGLDRVSKQSL